MAEKVVMPKFGMSMQEGTIAEWLKKENEPVKKGEPLVTISSEKITNELEAPANGVILKIMAKEDETLKVGNTLAYIGEAGENIDTSSNEEDKPSTSSKETSAASEVAATAVMTEEKRAPDTGKRIKISPAAKKMAKSNGVPMEELVGTGPQGRITKQDVQNYLDQNPAVEEEKESLAAAPASSHEQPSQDHANSKVAPAKGIRKVIADRMHQSLQESAQLTLMKKADITELQEIQKQAKQELQKTDADISLTLTAFIARATVMALGKHKAANSAYINDEIHTYETINLGMATSLDDGLVVPVVFQAENKTILELAESIYTLSKKARENRLSSDEMKGSTFTITNLGASGIEYFTPILNTPEAGILGVGTYQKSVVFQGGEIAERTLLPLSLTFDHRALDGDPASSFLNEIVYYLEHPYQMLL
ncbi:dihydrolipoamide acetyltransferase family protein [Thalassobacillus sp. B23F22_16]|uniref:dihydrolipoamide acetyltransferase family protein n=1 Tax=Thalassobacillus sp. B23F22_16 TaxID=3459513 RepID=UPI00373F967E